MKAAFCIPAVLWAVLCWMGAAAAQDREGEAAGMIAFASPAASPEPPISEEERRFRTRALVAAGALGVAAYGATHWWKQGVSSHFSTVNEGWFGQNTYAGGADKLGHAYTTYVGTRLLARGFEWAGNSPGRSLWLAGLTSFGTLAAVEIMDGFSDRYRFSKEDFIMNAAGTGLAVLLERKPELDALLDFRLMYWPSNDARRLNQVDPVDDHTSQTYLLVAKASGIPALRRTGPLRYFEFALGYGSRGYEPAAGEQRSRHVYYGISLNMAEILGDTVFRGSGGSRAQRITKGVLEVLQIPGTAALADHRL